MRCRLSVAGVEAFQRRKLNFNSLNIMTQINSLKSKLRIGLGALLTLCVALSGCASSSSTLATPTEELRSQGRIAVVNAEHRTIEIKTNEGESMVVSVLAATKLWQHGRHFTFDQMETGKYVVLQYSRDREGNFTAYRVVMYDDKGREPKPYPM
jgi:hypothetical protein